MIENLEYYKTFYYVAKTGSITGAAAELMVSQPAVSQAVHQLEKSLEVTLFNRSSRGIKLTQEGELLYRYVSKGYETIELGQQRLKQMLHLDAGEVRIGASDMTLRFFLLPYLEKFHELYPNIKVTVTNGPTPETLRSLMDGQIDFGVVSTPFENQPGIDSMPVKEIADTFVAGRRFTQYKNRMLGFEELEHLPLIFLEGQTSTSNYIRDFLKKNNVEIHPEFELATSDMIVQFALRNLGVGCVVKDFAKEYLDTGILFELRFNKIIPHRNFNVVKDNTHAMSIASSKLLELIRS
ncbi:MAG: LysR family transcriptional regulator [Butyrivibrio sp.]|nr:LysR family transcriptional regulator [Butyrivibrio sp.]